MLKNRSAVITGSTSGIGLGIAQALAHAGANVMLNGFGEAAAIEHLRSGLEIESGTRVLHHAADVSRGPEVAALIAATERAFGSVDILVNNAGIASRGHAVADTDPNELERVMRTHALGPHHVSRAVLPSMRTR